MKKRNQITAWGTEEDRQKLAILASLSKQSQSEWIIKKLREEFRELFGDGIPTYIPHK
jgi:hypothetical protein